MRLFWSLGHRIPYTHFYARVGGILSPSPRRRSYQIGGGFGGREYVPPAPQTSGWMIIAFVVVLIAVEYGMMHLPR
jgi:hypothetical protein